MSNKRIVSKSEVRKIMKGEPLDLEYFPEITACGTCKFYAAAYLKQADVHEAVHHFIGCKASDFETFIEDLSRLEQVACMPFVMLEEAPEDNHIPGPPLKGFSHKNPKIAPNLTCTCVVCMMFRTLERTYVIAMDGIFRIKDVKKIWDRDDYVMVKEGLELFYKYRRLGPAMKDTRHIRQKRREKKKVTAGS